MAESRAVFIDHPVFAAPAWGDLHPLAIARQVNVKALCETMGWLGDGRVVRGSLATFESLVRFHDPSYVTAFMRASAEGKVRAEDRSAFGFGTMENPIFPGIYERAAASIGCAVDAAHAALAGAIAFHPAGGTHHGRPGRASGFCYFNDPVFAIRALLDVGAGPVLYLDIDAHHGDGVQDAFAGHRDVMTVSIHEQGRWPYSGGAGDRGGGNARNMPVPSGLNDSEMDWLLAGPVADIAARFRPESVVIVAGADCLAGDPLSKMGLSNLAFWRAVESGCGFAGVRVVLGGGGYNPWTVTRGWSGLWARLAGLPIPDRLPAAACALLKTLSSDLIDDDEIDPLWTQSIADIPNEGMIRDSIKVLGHAITQSA